MNIPIRWRSPIPGRCPPGSDDKSGNPCRLWRSSSQNLRLPRPPSRFQMKSSSRPCRVPGLRRRGDRMWMHWKAGDRRMKNRCGANGKESAMTGPLRPRNSRCRRCRRAEEDGKPQLRRLPLETCPLSSPSPKTRRTQMFQGRPPRLQKNTKENPRTDTPQSSFTGRRSR